MHAPRQCSAIDFSPGSRSTTQSFIDEQLASPRPETWLPPVSTRIKLLDIRRLSAITEASLKGLGVSGRELIVGDGTRDRLGIRVAKESLQKVWVVEVTSAEKGHGMVPPLTHGTGTPDTARP